MAVFIDRLLIGAYWFPVPFEVALGQFAVGQFTVGTVRRKK